MLVAAVTLALTACAPPLPFAQQSPAAPGASVPVDASIAATVDPRWVEATARSTGIPAIALAAYAGAANNVAVHRPGCGLGWNTLAAIGLVESDHGRHDGSRLDGAGTASPPIYGVTLDGGDTANIADTDDGELDGVVDFDRAMGPMQLIPQSWVNWGYDASADGVVDPQNVQDAAVAAAKYLCRASDNDMSSPDGWRAGIAAYNSGQQYLADVAAAAQRYAAG